jgi:histo-blood group ABO system transferase
LPRVGLVVVATGRYTQFVPQLVTDVRARFLSCHDVSVFVLTDSQGPVGTTTLAWPRFGWPWDTLRRYHGIARYAGVLSECDYLFHLDADMRVVGTVGDEVLGDRVAVRHPGFLGRRGTYEERPESVARVAPHEGSTYFAGGFNGGSREGFLSTVREVVRMADADAARGIVAVWHDESYLNRHYVDRLPSVVLGHEYCFPEGWKLPGTPRIVALNKDHGAMRR